MRMSQQSQVSKKINRSIIKKNVADNFDKSQKVLNKMIVPLRQSMEIIGDYSSQDNTSRALKGGNMLAGGSSIYSDTKTVNNTQLSYQQYHDTYILKEQKPQQSLQSKITQQRKGSMTIEQQRGIRNIAENLFDLQNDSQRQEINRLKQDSLNQRMEGNYLNKQQMNSKEPLTFQQQYIQQQRATGFQIKQKQQPLKNAYLSPPLP